MSIYVETIEYYSSRGKGYKAFLADRELGFEYFASEELGKGKYLTIETKILTNVARLIMQEEDVIGDRVGIYNCCEMACIDAIIDFEVVSKVKGPNKVSPMAAPNTLANAAASNLAIDFKAMGPNFTISAGRNGMSAAMKTASYHLLNGRIDKAVILSAETNSPFSRALKQFEGQKHIDMQFGMGMVLSDEKPKGRSIEVHHQIMGHMGNRADSYAIIKKKIGDICSEHEISSIFVGGRHVLLENLIKELRIDMDVEVILPEGDVVSDNAFIAISLMAFFESGEFENSKTLHCSLDEYGGYSLVVVSIVG